MPFPGVSFSTSLQSNKTHTSRHWLQAHASGPIPEGVHNTQSNRNNTSQARNLCPFENCRFTHNNSVSILNDHISTRHAKQSLPETLIIPWQVRPCRSCNRFVCSRAVVSHSCKCPAQQPSYGRQPSGNGTTTSTSLFSSAQQPVTSSATAIQGALTPFKFGTPCHLCPLQQQEIPVPQPPCPLNTTPTANCTPQSPPSSGQQVNNISRPRVSTTAGSRRRSMQHTQVQPPT